MQVGHVTSLAFWNKKSKEWKVLRVFFLTYSLIKSSGELDSLQIVLSEVASN